MLPDPVYGMITCSLGDDGAATNGDTCNYACNDGNVRLSGDVMRICSDMMWSGNETVCVPGKVHITLYVCIYVYMYHFHTSDQRVKPVHILYLLDLCHTAVLFEGFYPCFWK